MTRCRFVPPYLLERVAASHPDAEACGCSRGTLAIDADLRSRRTSAPAVRSPEAAAASPAAAFSVYTAANGKDLPGRLVRLVGQAASGDAAVDEAYAGVQASLGMFADVFARDSYDGHGAPVVSTVHYAKGYDNAFWDGTQLVFGDGDGKVFTRFTKPIDVLGHEFTHAVTQFTAGLTYSGQSGALNESVSDCFACCLKQRVLGQSAAEADWLIGEGIFVPSVHGKALRSMAAPGTAYDDPVLGKDPQVASMSDYDHTTDDNGGVHINSGIPNRAFYLAATALGGNTWSGAGPIWYAALTSGIGASTDFTGFASATVAAADRVSPSAARAVRSAWTQVGVTAAPAPSGDAGPPGTSAPGPGVVEVSRSGGIAGLRRTGQIRLGDDPRTPEVEQLLGRIDLRSFGPHTPQPDRYVYAFRARGEEAVVGEADLTPELSRLATLLLDD
jgi:hypothetical protein